KSPGEIGRERLQAMPFRLFVTRSDLAVLRKDRLACSRCERDLGRRAHIPDQPATEHETDCNQLRATQCTAKQRATARITPQKFDKEACNTVEKEISPKNLAVEFLALEHPGEKKKDAQFNRRFE